VGGLALAAWLFATLLAKPSDEESGPLATKQPESASGPELQGREMPGPTHSPEGTPEGSTDGVRIVGRVVDETGGKAGPGVKVRVVAEGADAGHATTDAQGQFTFMYRPRPPYEVEVTLAAVAPSGRSCAACAQVAPAGPSVIDVGVLHLRAVTTLVVRTVSSGQPVAGARVYASSLPMHRRPQRGRGNRLGRPEAGFTHHATSDANGHARLVDLPVGAVQLLGVADGPRRGESVVSTQSHVSPIDLELVPARDLRVQVVWAADGRPIPGCVLIARNRDGIPTHEPGPRPVTDADGVAIVRGLPDDEAFEVVAIHTEWCSAYMMGLADTAEPGARALRIEIPAPTTLRFPFHAEDGPAPPDGTRVELDQSGWAFWPGTRLGLAPFGVIDGTEVVVDLHRLFHERATARLPDGRVGGFTLSSDYDRETKISRPRMPLQTIVFRKPRTVHVQVRERGTGRPVADVSLRAFLKSGDRRSLAMRTDEAGEARLEGLPAGQGWVSVCLNPDLVMLSRQGVFSPRQSIDLEGGDAHLEFEVEPRQEAVVEITTEGRDVLPPGFSAAAWLLPEGLAWRSPASLVVDYDACRVRLPFRPPPAEPSPPARPGGMTVLFRLASDTHATEYLRLDARGKLTTSIDLLPAGSLVTRIVKPDDMLVSTRLEVAGVDGVWTSVWDGAVVPFPEEIEHGELYTALRPGRYRLSAERLHWSSDEVIVRAGPEPAELVWDLTPKEFAEGDVVLPPGVDPKGLRIFVMEAEGGPRIVSSTSDLGGTHFRVQIPGDRPVVLTPIHPDCQPDEEEGEVTVTHAEKGLRLRMVPRAR
jgi:hypothetical protein